MVNDKKMSISSAVLKIGDKVSLKDKSYEHQNYLQAKENPRLSVPDYLAKEDVGGKEVGTVKDKAGLEFFPFSFSANLFAEYYSLRSV